MILRAAAAFVLLHDGVPAAANLRRERITPDELRAQARLRKIARLEDVRVALLETGGGSASSPVTAPEARADQATVIVVRARPSSP